MTATMKLFDLAPAYAQAMEIVDQMTQDGCTPDEIEEAMKIVGQIEADLNTKTLNIASWIRNLDAEAKAIKEAEDAMAKRRKAANAKADRLRSYLLYGLKEAGVSKVQFPHFVVSIKQNPESVKIAEGVKLPEEFLRYVDPEPNKAAIKEALKAGREVPGCLLERGEKLEIK